MTVLQRAEASEIILWSESVNRADVHRSQQGQSLWARQIMFFLFFIIDWLIYFFRKEEKNTAKNNFAVSVSYTTPASWKCRSCPWCSGAEILKRGQQIGPFYQ